MKTWSFAALVVAACMVSASARAEGDCDGTIARDDVVRCAMKASLTVRAEERGREAVEGRRIAASPFLPVNPVVSFSAGHRQSDTQRATNWYATVSQELELSGRRGARRRAAELEGEAQSSRIVVAKRDAAANAWIAYFDALAAADEIRVTKKLAANAAEIAAVARGMADRGLLAPVDADVADAGRIAVEQAALAAERRSRGARIALATALGLDVTTELDVRGELAPLRGVEEEARAMIGAAADERPEVKALEAERRAHEATASAYRRARIPNPTVSLFVQNDGFDERVLGAGVSLPVPLPQPVGRLYTGEIAEADALASRAATQAENARRKARADLASAVAEYDMRKKQREAFTDDRIARAEQGIEAIAKEIQAGRLGIRDALVSEQALVGVLRANLEARVALCLASVELARAANLPLERGGR